MTSRKIRSIELTDAPIKEALETALGKREPFFVRALQLVDDRGWSIMNQFQGVLGARGQVNYSIMFPGVTKAWHRHRYQTDFWFCTIGHLKVGVYRDDGELWHGTIGEHCPGICVIPKTLWHGASTIGLVPAGLFYYVSRAYSPEHPDEERRPFDSIEGFSWTTQHR